MPFVADARARATGEREWQNWQAFNIAVDQTFFDDRLGLEVAFDHQQFTVGQNQWLQGTNYQINVDVNQTYADGSPNPNVGRAFVGNSTSGNNDQETNIRNTVRATLTGELRAEDLLGRTRLAGILGRHVFTALYDRTTLTATSIAWAEYATTSQYIQDNNNNSRRMHWVPTGNFRGSIISDPP